MKLRSLLLAGVVFASNLAGAELDKKQAGELRRAAQQITNAEKQLDGYGEGKTWGVIKERPQGDFEGKIARAKEMLDKLPATDPDVKAELEHLAKLSATLKIKVNERLAKEGAKANAEATAEALFAAPAYEVDKKALEEMKEIFSTARWWALDFYIWERWTTHGDLEKMRGWGKRWPEIQKQFTALRAKYAPAMAINGGVGKGQLMMKVNDIKELADEDANEDFTAFNASVAAFIKDVPARIEADGTSLNAQIEKAGSTNNWSAILNEDGDIKQMRNRLVNIPSVYTTLVGATEAAAVDKSAKAASESADKALAKYAEKLVASNTAPANSYAGGDKDKLEALIKKQWKTEFPSEAILAIRFRMSEFERTTQWVVDTNATSATKRDFSRLRATVIVKSGAKEAVLWSVLVLKNHMANDTIEITSGYRSSKGPSPEQRMLLANFK